MAKSFSVLAAALLIAAGPRLPAQKQAGATTIGPVHMTFDGGRYVGSSLHLSGVVMTSEEYDLQAASVVADMPPPEGAGKASSPTKIVALGDPVKKTQVQGRFLSALEARTYLVRGDKAVYVPEPGRQGGGRIDFTGNVVVTLQAPQALDGPAVTHMEHATVRVGPKPDYPQVEFGPGRLDLTPLQ